MDTLILSPAYGRDFDNAKDAITSFLEGEDWEILGGPAMSGTYCTYREIAMRAPEVEWIELRYSGLRKLALLATK